ncbi:MAG: hypothetical protein DPW09_43975 [Anaerolineae bacterium]|nr:hypothetical protein [Anaerolineales bacterium]MCQ3980419.1 hypothetical protein [Anaerolineae bacterium]
MQHPDLLLDLARFEQQNRLREAETWRLARAARQERAEYGGRFLRRLVTAARHRLRLPARPWPVKPAER